MKFAISLLVALSTLSAWANCTHDEKITMNMRKATTADVLKVLSDKTNVNIIVEAGVDMAKLISVNVKDASVKDVLDFVASEQGVKWSESGEHQIKITKI